jgi:hypothetical protein
LPLDAYSGVMYLQERKKKITFLVINSTRSQ